MPTYEYICHNSACGHEFETFQSMKDESLSICPECEQSSLRRKIGLGAGIIFKGSGFYQTDYKRKEPSAANTESKSESPKTETKKETPSSNNVGSKSSE